MKRTFVVIICCIVAFVGHSSWAADLGTEARLIQVEASVADISHCQRVMENEVSLLEKKTDAIGELVSESTSTISNEIAASDRLMGILSVAISLFIVLLGVYVAWMQRRVLQISDTVKRMSDEVEKKKEEVSSLAKEINSNFDALYLRIRRADTKAYVKRLEQVPLDDMNLGDLLLARDLEDEDFYPLKNAYMKVVELGKEHDSPQFAGPNHGQVYRLLFFQNFLGRSILDDFLRERIVSDFDQLVTCCFDNDVLKSMSDIAPVLSHRNVPFDRVTVLKKLLAALDKSEYCSNEEVYSILKNGISDDDLWEAARRDSKL